MAPEIMDGKQYTASADVWSLGVLLYIFLSGYMPYTAKSQEELRDKISSHKLVFNHKEFDSVSKEAKDLITKILQVKANNRPSALKILEHPWFAKFGSSKTVTPEEDLLDAEVVRRLKTFKGQDFFKRAAINFFVSQIDQNSIQKLSE